MLRGREARYSGAMAGHLIVFAGLPGVGKTTLARALSQHIEATYIRIDSLEQGMRNGGISQSIGGAGYSAAHAVAGDNLDLGRTVVADSVNPWKLTRDDWRDVAEKHEASCVEVEVVCSDVEEHRRRVQTRQSDVPRLKLPSWASVLARDYHPWDRSHLVVDTANRSVTECVAELLAAVRAG